MDVDLVVDHPGYTDNGNYNDFSLIKLAQKIDFAGNSHVRPVSYYFMVLSCTFDNFVQTSAIFVLFFPYNLHQLMHT